MTRLRQTTLHIAGPWVQLGVVTYHSGVFTGILKANLEHTWQAGMLKSLVIQVDITDVLLLFCLCWPIYTVWMETHPSTSEANVSSQKLGEKKVIM